MVKKRRSIKLVFLCNLLLGILLPFVIVLVIVAVQMYRDVAQDKASSYSVMAQMMSDNVNEVVHKYVSVVETAAVGSRTGCRRSRTVFEGSYRRNRGCVVSFSGDRCRRGGNFPHGRQGTPRHLDR